MALKITNKPPPKLEAPSPPKQQDNGKTALPVTPTPTTFGGFGSAGTAGDAAAAAKPSPTAPLPTSAAAVLAQPETQRAVLESIRQANASRAASTTQEGPAQAPQPTAPTAPTSTRKVGQPPAPTTPFQKFQAQFGFGTLADNPFAGAGDPNYDPSFQAPSVLEDADKAELYLKDAKTAVRGLVQNSLGEWGRETIDASGFPQFTPATDQELLFIERIGELELAIDSVRTNAASTEATNAANEAALIATAFDEFLRQQEEEDKNQAQTPEQVAAIEQIYNQRFADLESRLAGEEIAIQEKAQLSQQITGSTAAYNQQLKFVNTSQRDAVLVRDEALVSGDARAAAEAQASFDFFQLEELRLEKEKFQLELFSTLAKSPLALYYSGSIAADGDAKDLDEAVARLTEAAERVPAVWADIAWRRMRAGETERARRALDRAPGGTVKDALRELVAHAR